jgi:hypothetical protein
MDRFRIQSLAKILREKVLTPEQEVLAKETLEEKMKIYTAGALKRGKEKEVAEIRTLVELETGIDKAFTFPVNPSPRKAY